MPISDAAFRQALAASKLILGMLAFPASYHFIVVGGVDANGYIVHDPHYDAPFPATFDEIVNYPEAHLDEAWMISSQ